jgi:hypothetical protein
MVAVTSRINDPFTTDEFASACTSDTVDYGDPPTMEK